MKKMILAAGLSTGFMLSFFTPVHAALYSPVACDSQSFFSQNTCDLCYEEKVLTLPGQKLIGLFDTWQGHDMNPPIVYEDEQTERPIMINLGGSGTKWTYSSSDIFSMWEFTPEIPWTTSGATDRKVVKIEKDQSLKFVQQKKDAYILLETTDKKKSEYIGMMKFPLIYRYLDPNTGMESAPIPHYECVAYKADVAIVETGITIVPPTTQAVPPKEAITPAVTQPAPVEVKSVVTPPAPTPKQITATKTGPELWLMGIIALMITPIILFIGKKKV